MDAKNLFILLVGVIPVVYGVFAFAVSLVTDVFAPETRGKFALLYALLAVVAGISDFLRFKFDQQRPEWLPARPYSRAAIRGHAVTLMFVLAGAGISYVLDIDTGWPLVVALMCGPVTGRALALFVEFTRHVASSVFLTVMEAAFSLSILILILAVIRGR